MIRPYLTEDKWDHRFLDLAEHIALWSKDDSTKVAAVVVDPAHRIISHGFNGFPRGVDDTILSRDQKLMRTIHGEANALHFAARDVSGCSIYITHPPCSHCAAHIIQRGITRVVFNRPDEHFLSRWLASYQESLEMFSEARTIVLERAK